jgi:cell division protein ZapB
VIIGRGEPPDGAKKSFADADFLRRRMIRKHMQNRPLFLDAAADLKHSAVVDAELNSLEAKVAQFVGLCERLRAENHDLRQQLASARNDAKRLNERIEGAKLKLESLLERLPD